MTTPMTKQEVLDDQPSWEICLRESTWEGKINQLFVEAHAAHMKGDFATMGKKLAEAIEHEAEAESQRQHVDHGPVGEVPRFLAKQGF